MKLKLCSRRKKIYSMIFLFLGVFALHAQTLEIEGTVSDENGVPLPGVSVLVQNTTRGTSTDIDGKFSIDNVQQGENLVFSYIGYKTVVVAIENSNYLNVSMEPDMENLDEVIVTALGIKREQKALGYAVQEVQGATLQRVQGVDAATALTGKVAGLLVTNSTDFNVEPVITIRGESPLLVIDGIAYANKTFNDISSEDIESLNVLKGATASALYGFRGANGAILITTKNGSTSDTSGLSVDITTNTMFAAGYLAIPEKQSVYGRGTNNTYDINNNQSWGTVMDGTIRTQWDPFLKEDRDYEYLPVGKNNFKNFLEQGYITNNNVNVSYRQENVALRSSVNWTQNKGQYPNSKLDKYTYTLGGDVNLDKFQLTSNLSYSRRYTPNMGSNGYTSYDPMYALLIYGSADFNILDYKNNYWLKEGEVQNYTFQRSINNPYFDRYEKTNEVTRDIFNADLSLNYEVADWLKITARAGIDTYVDSGKIRISQGSYTSSGNTSIPGNPYTWNGTNTGAYMTGKTQGFSINSDLLLTGSTSFLDDFDVEYLAGGTIYYTKDENLNAETVGGISVPGFFSLNASVNPAAVAESTRAQQVNSLFGSLAFSWRKLIYVDVTGRNDWFSTQAGPGMNKSDYSYFYPSFSGSFVVSELLPESTKSWLDLLKVRSSWTMSKSPASIYERNSVFSIIPGTWNDWNGASAPNALYDPFLTPETNDTYEVGLQGIMFKKRLTFDVTYYNIHMYDMIVNGSVTAASGYTSNKVNTDEERERRGWEVALTGTPIVNDDFRWDIGLNWSTYKEVYTKLDELYTSNRPWIKVGERTDPYIGRDFLKDPATGQFVYSNGRIQREVYDSVFGYQNPDWLWGVNSTLKYKNWSLFMSLDGVVGGMMTTRTESYMWNTGGHPDSVTPERALDVANPGTSNYIGEGVKVVSGSVEYDTFGNITSDTRVFAPNDIATTYKQAIVDLHAGSAWGGTGRRTDAYSKTFFKLRELSITYDVPTEFLKKWGPIKKASVSFIGQNVLLWSKDFKYSDPDGGREDFADPSIRYLGVNMKLKF